MLQQENFSLYPPRDVRSNTHYVYHMITPSAACQLNHRLHLQRSIKGSAETTLCMWDLRY